jgi:hypothetical protein
VCRRGRSGTDHRTSGPRGTLHSICLPRHLPPRLSRAPDGGTAFAAKTPHARDLIDRDIAATDRRIDELVCKFYGLTDKEIGIIEDAMAKG